MDNIVHMMRQFPYGVGRLVNTQAHLIGMALIAQKNPFQYSETSLGESY